METVLKSLSEMEVKAHVSPGVGPLLNKIADKAEGSYVWTTDGVKYLDLTCGIGVTSTGHCHPKVAKAVAEQALRAVHIQQGIFAASNSSAELFSRFNYIMPPHLNSYFLCNSGSEAVENAMKLARNFTKRPNIIAFKGGYHGRTYGAMSVTTSKNSYKSGFEPMNGGVIIADYPYQTYKVLHREDAENYGTQDAFEDYKANFELTLKTLVDPNDVAGVLIEPIQGEGGFLVPPAWFLLYIQDVCKQYGWVFICDEVQSGAGRTGKWWAHEYFPGVQPDIMTFAKGIASGFPFAGMVSRLELHAFLVKGSMGGTYGGSALGCAASCATIDAIVSEKMLENAIEQGEFLRENLRKLAQEYPEIVDVRGKGLMTAVEFSKKGSAAKLVQEAVKRDMLILSAGPRDVIRFLPPLNIKQVDLSLGLKRFSQCLEAVFKPAENGHSIYETVKQKVVGS